MTDLASKTARELGDNYLEWNSWPSPINLGLNIGTLDSKSFYHRNFYVDIFSQLVKTIGQSGPVQSKYQNLEENNL